MKDKICTIKIIDEVNCVIIGLDENERQMLTNQFAIFAKGYNFSPKFKLGIWDGKINFFSLNGKTYINLLEQIIPEIKKLGYKFAVKDQRSSVLYSIPQIDETYFKLFNDFILAEHQVNAINAITKDHIGLIEAATGSGKSAVNAVICDLYHKYAKLKSITIVPTTDLVLQTKQTFTDFGLDVGEYSGNLKDIDHAHVICTWQSMNKNPMIMGMFQVVIADEAHLCTGQSLQKILNEYGSHIMVRIGLTGTVPTDPCSAMTVKCTLGDIKYTVPASDLIELGWLSDLHIKMYQTDENLLPQWEEFREKNPEDWAKTTYKEFKKQAFPDFPSEQKYISTKHSRNSFISELIIGASEDEKGNSLILVNSIKQAQRLQELIPNSIYVAGKDKSKVRKYIFDLFSTSNDLVVIATYKLASTGLNIPRIFNLFLIDAGKSFTTIIQSIGRGLRKAVDKDWLNVHDICSDLKYAKRHATERLGFYKSQKYNYTKHIVKYE